MYSLSETIYLFANGTFRAAETSNLSTKVSEQRNKNKRTHRPWIAHLNPCQEKRLFTTKYKTHSPTPTCILGITQIITKAYQVT